MNMGIVIIIRVITIKTERIIMTAELLQYQHVRSDIDVGKRSGFGMLASETPLSAAATEGHTEMVAELLKAGANLNTPFTVGLGMLASGTPLYAAAFTGHTEVVAALLKAGADPNTPLTVGLGMLEKIYVNIKR